MTSGPVDNTISGGTQHGPVLMGRNFRDVHIETVVQATAAPVALAQLPPLGTAFTGRDRELAEVTALLSPKDGASAAMVSAVAGLAGVGKTALAVQAAHRARQAGWFPGGVLFIDLHGYDTTPIQPGQALDAFLRALGVPGEHIPAGTAERAGLYRSVLAAISDPVLIVADNASSEAQVRPVLPGPGPHRIIVTSRHTLAGLDARLLDVEILSHKDAMSLLDAALRAARPGDSRISDDDDDDDDDAGARRLARACGGLPLALRITAALLISDPVLTAGELAEELADETRGLATLQYDDGGGTSAPSVAAAFDLSYQQLNAHTARLFRLLPFNPGPDVSTEAAAVLAGATPPEIRKMLGQLTKAHLVEVAAGTGRWRMHDLLSLYARQLPSDEAEPDERNHARSRILMYYLYRAAIADTYLQALPGMVMPPGFTGRTDALVWLDVERPNLIGAAIMAADTDSDLIAIELPIALSAYLHWRRHFDDLLTVLIISRDTAHRLGNHQTEAEALTNLGTALMEVRRFEEAIRAYQNAAEILRQIKDLHNEGIALTGLGLALHQMRRFDEAIPNHRAAAEIFKETEDQRGKGSALNNLGLTQQEIRQFDEAVRAHQEAAEIFHQIGDQDGEGKSLNNLGGVLRKVQRFDEAIRTHQAAVRLFQQAENSHSEAQTLGNLGVAFRHERRFNEAIDAHQKAVEIFQRIGDQHGEGTALSGLGLALMEVQRFDEAIRALQDATEFFRLVNDEHSKGMALNNLGVAFRHVRRFDEAIHVHQDAAEIFHLTKDPYTETIALDNVQLDQSEKKSIR